jgi:Flp pilus assembly protein TadG
MAECLLTGGITIDCSSLKSVGGISKTFYAVSKENIASYAESNGYITSIVLDAYTYMYKFVGQKRGNSKTVNLVVQAGANKFFEHVFTGKLYTTSPTDDGVIEELAVTDVVIFSKDNNGIWFAYGIDNGMEVTAFTQTSGTEAATDTSDTLTFTGQETRKPRRLDLGGGTEQALEYLTAN